MLFVWNVWWMRQVLSASQSIFWCPSLFAPFGVSLTLNTLAPLPSGIVALLPAGTLAATNVLIAGHLFLNFAVTHALAWRATRSHAASAVAALAFAWSPYVGTHLAGHFNLIGAWVLPLTALAFDCAATRASVTRAVLLGVVVGACIYIEYYYAVYAAVLVATLAAHRMIGIGLVARPRARWQAVALGVIGVLLTIALLAIAIVLSSGGRTFRLAGATISMHGVDNPVAAAGLLLLLAAAVVWLPRVRLRIEHDAAVTVLRVLVIAAATAILIAAPVLISAFRLWLAGDYVSQTYFWRSAPRGIDLATLVLGNPAGFLTKDLSLRAYGHFGIDVVEQTAWMAPAAVLLAIAAVVLRRSEQATRTWMVVAAAFGIWALGPFLAMFGERVNVLLPAILIRYVPVVANARVPARAIVLVYLAVAMLAACGFAALRSRGARFPALALAGVLVIDYAPRPVDVFRLDRPSIYDVIKSDPSPGVVCELPLGLRDSFGEHGRFDSRVLWYQTLHERPMTGGFVSRLPPRVIEGYRDSPILGSLVRLSGGSPLNDEAIPVRSDAAVALKAMKIRYFVVDTEASPPALLEYVRALPVRQLGSDAGRTLYVLDGSR